jgi:hypothetical protein
VIGAVFLGIGVLIGRAFLGLSGVWLALFALMAGIAAGLAVQRGALMVTGGAAGAISRFVYPTGDSTPYEISFSAHDALAIRGDTAGAIAAYDATMVAEPENVRARRQAAELHAQAGNATRAASLFVEMRRMPRVTPRDELYATQRLADLFLGALGDDGRALVELRRIVERFPGTGEATGARTAIERLKRERDEPAEGSIQP